VRDPDEKADETNRDSSSLPTDPLATVSLTGGVDMRRSAGPAVMTTLAQLLPRGTNIGRYVILDPLGHGGAPSAPSTPTWSPR
jgi:hypothetical protein